MENLILILIIIAIAGGAAGYIYKAKKNGAHCIGCPNSKQCGKNCDCPSKK